MESTCSLLALRTNQVLPMVAETGRPPPDGALGGAERKPAYDHHSHRLKVFVYTLYLLVGGSDTVMYDTVAGLGAIMLLLSLLNTATV